MSELRSRTAGSVPGTDPRQDDAERPVPCHKCGSSGPFDWSPESENGDHFVRSCCGCGDAVTYRLLFEPAAIRAVLALVKEQRKMGGLLATFLALHDGPFKIDRHADGGWSVTWWQHHPTEPWYRWGRTTEAAAESLDDALREAIETIQVGSVITTTLGRFRRVSDQGIPDGYVFECPGCGQWAHLDDDQWHGRVSVDHAADGCPGGYHETHDYASALREVSR